MNVATDVKIEDQSLDNKNSTGLSFINRIVILFWKQTTLLNKPGIGEVAVPPPSMPIQAPPEVILSAEANPPVAPIAAHPARGKARHIWSANHASGGDVTQSPSNLG